MKFIAILITSIFLFGCGQNTRDTRYKPTRESIERERLCDTIMSKVAVKLQHEKGLIPCGSGGQTSHGVQMLALSFDYRQPTTIENGRKLLIAAVQEFVQSVNAEEQIRPYLQNYPFEAKNVQISIFLQNPDGSKLSSGLHVISAYEGILNYNIDDPEGPLFKTLLEETYEEALQKLHAQKDLYNATML
jgi:hypothetical protein